MPCLHVIQHYPIACGLPATVPPELITTDENWPPDSTRSLSGRLLVPLGAPTHTKRGPSHHFDHSWYTFDTFLDPPKVIQNWYFFESCFWDASRRCFLMLLGRNLLLQTSPKWSPQWNQHRNMNMLNLLLFTTLSLDYRLLKSLLVNVFLTFFGDVKMVLNCWWILSHHAGF